MGDVNNTEEEVYENPLEIETEDEVIEKKTPEREKHLGVIISILILAVVSVITIFVVNSALKKNKEIEDNAAAVAAFNADVEKTQETAEPLEDPAITDTPAEAEADPNNIINGVPVQIVPRETGRCYEKLPAFEYTDEMFESGLHWIENMAVMCEVSDETAKQCLETFAWYVGLTEWYETHDLILAEAVEDGYYVLLDANSEIAFYVNPAKNLVYYYTPEVKPQVMENINVLITNKYNDPFVNYEIELNTDGPLTVVVEQESVRLTVNEDGTQIVSEEPIEQEVDANG